MQSNRCQGQSYRPHSLLLQWHVTERCNLRCAHCYQEAYSGKELRFRDLLIVIEQFKDLLDRWRRESKQVPVRGHITITGGEPFVRQDFLDILEVFSANRDQFSFAILTNGNFINADMARRLHKLGPAFVQVSVEGIRTTHDKVRGSGDFDKVISAVKHLMQSHIRTLISFTAHRGNFREFPEVARFGRRLKVDRVWADRMIPWGSGSALKEQMLTPDETSEFFKIMYKVRREVIQLFSQTEVAMHRALQFLVAGGKPYHCTAGDSLITVMPNGDLYPCRRMPIRVGNMMETPLAELYYRSELFHALRDKQRISEGCEGCSYSRVCRGGLKCLSYAMTGDIFKADPGCWLRQSKAK